MTEIEYLKQENKKLVKALDDYGNKNFKYKQALEEIRELLGSACVNEVHCDSEELIKCKENLCEIGKAKTLIDEVLNDRD